MKKSDLYKILITGPPISGKTLVAERLEKDFTSKRFIISNLDVDYDENWRVIPSQSDIYMLQTPHGSEVEKIDGIKFEDFDKLIYVNSNHETYLKFLASRGDAWFREGVVEKTEDFNPTPYSFKKLPKIIEKIARYASDHERIIREDINYFKKNNLEVKTIIPILKEDSVHLKNYQKVFNEILNEVN